ncbi:MAG: [FeFe] hydrogenase H-cluster radical SAM maturase HydG [Deltaproteobacteria bacterium RBG_13_61_14]|nr:MAG: [FeFe] hydrogenase H-cluster radical SAM maturase HydG [Deltaproteobacteria bacterium RBG_13_61_14]
MMFDLQYLRRLTETAAPAKNLAEVLAKAEALEKLSLEEVASLLAVTDAEDLAQIRQSGFRVKQEVFGPRVVLFAPLYLSNRCINNCLYCGFRAGNRERQTRTLSPEEAAAEAGHLAQLGYQRLLLVTSEHPDTGADYLEAVVRAIYERAAIRILHLNAPPMSQSNLRRLKEAGLGVYQVFQETYDPECYRELHPSGPKADFSRRLAVMDDAIAAGFDDVGLGVLLGLHHHRFEALATVAHSYYLRDRYHLNPHTLSVPRLRPAEGSPITTPPAPVSDPEFLKIVALYRLAVPTAGVVVTTRESKETREQALGAGASQISAGSRTDPGGYSEEGKTSQFEVEDRRTLEEVILDLVAAGHLPSLCTACYRSGRTGVRFAEMAGAGEIAAFCQSNAILTLAEYLAAHSSDGRFAQAEAMLQHLLEEIPDQKLRQSLARKLEEAQAGARDLHY